MSQATTTPDQIKVTVQRDMFGLHLVVGKDHIFIPDAAATQAIHQLLKWHVYTTAQPALFDALRAVEALERE